MSVVNISHLSLVTFVPTLCQQPRRILYHSVKKHGKGVIYVCGEPFIPVLPEVYHHVAIVKTFSEIIFI